jgi:biopolymer transport protein ExbD
MKIKKAATNVSEMDMTPMIDMTFQLVSFFMFAINFNSELINEQINLPVAEMARPVDKAKVEPLFLNVSRDGKLQLIGESFVIQDPNDMAKINAYLKREATLIKLSMQKAGKSGAAGLEATVIIRGDERVPYGAVQDLIRACREAGFVKFSLRATLKSV